MSDSNPTLKVDSLLVTIPTTQGTIRAVDRVTFSVHAGEIFGIVGESGSGKTTLGLSIVKLLPLNARIDDGAVYLHGINLSALEERQMTDIRGKEIGFIFQDPSSYLNPLMRVGSQIAEAIRIHKHIPQKEAFQESTQVMGKLGIREPEKVAYRYPYELSAGMRQRVMIAIALSAEPSLIIADEPTSNLDVTTQAQVATLLYRVCKENHISLILITHNLGLAAWICDRVGVMYAGRLVETGPTEVILDRPNHPYTQALLRAFPSVSSENLSPIDGDVPNLINLPENECHFRNRCAFRKEICERKRPDLYQIQTGAAVSCLKFSTEW